MKEVNILSASRSVVDNYMNQLRNVELQNDREKFRTAIRRIGRVIGYELSKSLEYETKQIRTPLDNHSQPTISDQIVVITILRAGLPLHEGLLDIFPDAENGFISAYRKHEGEEFHIEVDYVACPNLENKVLILNDPMLATGQSFINAWKALQEYGKPKSVHLAAVIGSEEGVSYISENALSDYKLWVGGGDPILNKQKYIVPGLGDAGDLAFGNKLQG